MTDRAVATLGDARRAGVDLYGLVARPRMGELLGGDEGRAMIAEAVAGAEQRGIRNLPRTLAALAPWPEPRR